MGSAKTNIIFTQFYNLHLVFVEWHHDHCQTYQRSTVVMLSVLRQIHLTQDQVVSHPMLFTPATVDARHQTLARAPNLRVCPPPEASDNLSYLCLLLLRFRERLVQASINKYTTFITSLLLCCLGKLTIIQDQVNGLYIM